MRDDAVDCRRAESRFSLVNTCNLTDTDKDTSSGVLRGQRTGSVRVNPPKTASQLNTEDYLKEIVLGNTFTPFLQRK